MSFDYIINTCKNAPIGAIVGAVLFKAARREQSAIPKKNSKDIIQALCKLALSPTVTA